jgi:hypothetical protein
MSNNYLRHCSREGKTIRITISVEGRIEAKISNLHELMSAHSGNRFSMSKVINMLLLGGILASQRMTTQDWYVMKRFADGQRLELEEFVLEDYVSNLTALRQIV